MSADAVFASIREIHGLTKVNGVKSCQECFRPHPCPTFAALPPLDEEDS